MKPAVAKAPARETVVDRFKQRILHGYCVRFHMSLIVTAVVASGVLTSKLLLLTGLHSLRLRYPLAVLSSYAVFLLLVRVWIWYVSRRSSGFGFDLGNLDLSGGRGGGGGWGGGNWGTAGGSGPRFGGGDFGGGGASDLWSGSANEAAVPAPMPSPMIAPQPGSNVGGSGFSLPKLDLDLGDDGWWIVLLLAALVIVIFCAGGYLVWAAPQILPDAACQALFASTLVRLSKEHHHGWMSGVLRSTAIPFGLVLLLATALGWVAHNHCPQAARLIDALHCAVAR